MIPTNYFHYTRGSFWRAAILTTVLALSHAFLFGQTNCDADAGSLNGEICIQNQTVTLRATLRGDTTVPDSFQIVYVLTRGENLVIEEVSEEASFTIDEMEGLYTIHTLVYDSTTLDLDSIVTGQTTGSDIFERLIAGGGTICAALDTAGVRFRFGDCDLDGCDADAGSIVAVEGACFDDSTGMATLTATIEDTATVPDGYQVVYVLSSSDSLSLVAVSDSASFTVDTTGTYRIHVLVYDTTTLNLDSLIDAGITGGDLNLLLLQGGGDICGALDVTGAVFEIESCDDEDDCSVDAGTVSTDDDETTFTICIGDGDSDIIELNNTDAEVDGGTYVYVLTNTANVILNIIQDDSENLDGIGTDSTYRIWGYVYSGDSTSLAIGDTLSAASPLDSCSDISTNFITIVNDCDVVDPACDVATGRLTGAPIGCLEDGDSLVLTATVQTAATVPSGFDVIYVLTSGDSLTIEQVNDEPSFEVDSAGTYRIHVLVYDSTTLDLGAVEFGETTGGELNEMLLQGGGEICAALDVTGVLFNVVNCSDVEDSCAITFGRLVAVNDSLCLEEGGSVTLEGSLEVAPVVLDSYQLVYVLTSGDSLVIEEVNDDPSFTIDSVGTYRIHVLVYDSTTLDIDSLVTFGETTGADVNELLIQGGGDICAALDTNGLLFNIEICEEDTCDITAGTLRIVNEDYCLGDSTATLTVEVADSADIPEGYVLAYVLTSGDSLIVEAIDTIPSFTVDTVGEYRVHAFVFSATDTASYILLDSLVELGETSALELLPLLAQGGGDICAALNAEGTLFDVMPCDTTGTPDTCDITIGILSPDGTSFCIDSTGSVTLAATFVTQPELPTGYEVAYVLTSGDSLVIEQVSDTASFVVDTIGRYTIHTLVYNPDELDVDSLITIGETTGGDVNSLLIQGGGEICGGLDVEGLVFNVIDCDDYLDSCIVSSGALRIVDEAFCLGDSTATLSAAIQTVPNVGPGYQILYVLTSGDDLVIEEVSTTATFDVDTTGDFRIHVLVYDSTTLNLDSLVMFGETTGADLDSLLVQGGGDICASLDTEGLLFEVEECTIDSNCTVTAGSLSASSTPCLADTASSVTLSATVAEEPTVPAGYQVTYVLTSGTDLVIQAVNDEPTFDVDSTGRYTIHTLVYDSTTLDLGLIQFGTTTGGDVNELLVQGGGDICAALDVSGVRFNVISCDSTGVDSCEVMFDTGDLMIIGNDVRCYEGASITTALRFTDSPNVPSGYAVAFVISEGDSNTITQVNDVLSLTVDSVGLYRIQVVIYDSTSTNLGSFIGSTTADLNGSLVQGGGGTCGALDTVGIVFVIKDCTIDSIDCEEDIATGSLSAQVNNSCLSQDSTMVITAQVVEEATVPAGYEVIYVLTSGAGLVIEAVSENPSFTVDRVGQYRIHVLVYNPNTLDLDDVILGTTQAEGLNSMLIQGGGEVCAALDLEGALFIIRDCDCGASPGELTYTGPDSGVPCLGSNGLVFLVGNTRVRPIIPPGYRRLYILTSGNDMVIERVADIPVFGVRATGTYRIHTLIYDPNTLDLSDIVYGETTAMEINALLRQGGGDICAGLELPGLRFTVGDCVSGEVERIVAYPNPATSRVNLMLPQTDDVQRVSIELIDANGTIQKQWQTDGFSNVANLDISDIQPGMYYIRVLHDQEFVQDLTIVKVR